MIAIDFAGKYGTKWAVYDMDASGKILKNIFIPHPKQITFFDTIYESVSYILFGGGRGGGKTASLIWLAVFIAYLLPGSRVIIFRRTMGELKKTIIDGFLNLPKGIYLKCTEDCVTYDNGSKTWFGSADDEKAVRKLLSGEYDGMIFDEWSEWPLSMWKFAAGSCRSTREKDVFNRPYAPKIWGGSNPGGVGGATLDCLFGCSGKQKQAPGEDPALYDPKEYRFIQSLVSDNPAYAETKPAGIAYRKMLNSQPRRIRAAWLEGRWDGFEGQYFDCLDEERTRIDHDKYLQLIRKQHWAPRWISIDWGSVHHAYAAWHALLQIGKTDYVVTYHEYLTKGMGEAALAEEISDHTESMSDIKHIQKIYLSPDCFGENTFSRAKKMGNVFVARGMKRPVPANNDRIDGWRVMHSLLEQKGQQVKIGGTDDSPATPLSGWLITDDCPNALESLPQAVCDPKKDGDVLKEGDAPHLDVNDGLRYGIASHIQPVDRPFDDRLKEELSKLPMEGPDRYIRHMQLQKQERENNPGVFYLGRRPRR